MAESRGLGDSIEKFTKATGIKKVVESATELVTGKKDCGCSERRDKLNRLFPYKNKEKQYDPLPNEQNPTSSIGPVVTDNRAGVAVTRSRNGVIRRAWSPKGKTYNK